MKEGIQATLKNPRIRKYGCYLLSLIQASKPESTEEDIENYYQELLDKGYIDIDCFINNPEAIIQYLGGAFPLTIRKWQRPLFTHFTLLDWDPLPPNRPAAKLYNDWVDYEWDATGHRSYVDRPIVSSFPGVK